MSYQKLAKDQNKTKGLPCHICVLKEGRLFSGRSALYEHYASVHYKEDIEFMFGLKYKADICPECCLKKTDLVKHLGATHNYVEKFLPKPHHISRKLSSPSPSLSFALSPSNSLSPGLFEKQEKPTNSVEFIQDLEKSAIEPTHDSEDDNLINEFDAELATVWAVGPDEAEEAVTETALCDVDNIEHDAQQMEAVREAVDDASECEKVVNSEKSGPDLTAMKDTFPDTVNIVPVEPVISTKYDETGEAQSIDHCYLARIQVNESPSPPIDAAASKSHNKI